MKENIRKKYKIISNNINILLNNSIDKINHNIDFIKNIDEIIKNFEYKSRCVSSYGNRGGVLKLKIDDNIILIDFEINVDGEFICNLDYTSFMSSDEIVNYLSFIDSKKINEIINPSGVYGFDELKIPLHVDNYEKLSTNVKKDLIKLVKNSESYKREIKINSVLD